MKEVCFMKRIVEMGEFEEKYESLFYVYELLDKELVYDVSVMLEE